MKFDIIVVGGGAAGTMAACVAADQGMHIGIIESNDILGKKLLATGNGRCNFTNDYMSISCFRTDSDFGKMEQILQCFPKEQTLEWFTQLGIIPKIRFGTGYYPLSMQASQVREAWEIACRQRQIHVFYHTRVLDIAAEQGQFCIMTNNGKFYSSSVIVTTGGYASPKTGSDGSLFPVYQQLGHTILSCVPALVPLISKDPMFPLVQGVRTDGRVTVIYGNDSFTDRGELQFTKEGISGIPVFQISRYVAKLLQQQQRVTVECDLFPDIPEDAFQTILYQRFYEMGWYKTCREAMVGMLPDKLIQGLFQRCHISLDENAASISKGELKQLQSACKHLSIFVVDTKGFAAAQTTAGGISLNDVTESLESKHIPGLYFAGEVLDVDGICGGYNLQWAWSSGYVVGQAASSRKDIL